MAAAATTCGPFSGHWQREPRQRLLALRGVPCPAHCSRGGARSFASTAKAADPYEVLGVSPSASQEEIKKAYRKQAMAWHPDRCPEEKREEAQRRFAEIANAYELLSDPEKRRLHDSGGSTGAARDFGAGGPGFAGGGMPHDFHSQESAERLFRDVFGQRGFEDLLGHLFNQDFFGEMGGPAVLKVGSEVRINGEANLVLEACRQSGIDSTNDAKRRRCLGKKGKIIKVDPKDQSVKVSVPGVGDVWFGSRAVQLLQREGHPFGDPFSHAFRGMPGGGGAASGASVSTTQEIVQRPDGKRVIRVTRTTRTADGQVRQEVTETEM